MDQAIKTKWIEALRSDKYEQGRNRLRSAVRDEFCCLGVLCDIVDPEGWELRGSWMHQGEGIAYCPTFVLVEAGLTEEEQTHLATMNDKWEYNFNRIAEHIEVYL